LAKAGVYRSFGPASHQTDNRKSPKTKIIRFEDACAF
jgi:hypothetical protein